MVTTASADEEVTDEVRSGVTNVDAGDVLKVYVAGAAKVFVGDFSAFPMIGAAFVGEVCATTAGGVAGETVGTFSKVGGGEVGAPTVGDTGTAAFG